MIAYARAQSDVLECDLEGTKRVRRLGPLWLSALLTATALSTPALAAAPVLPTGGKVVAGSAAIGAPSGGALVITQSSSKAIIDWTGFSIGQDGKVAFNNGKGATLNRVTGGSISSLDGMLNATGSVYVINPNGVIIGKTGVVDVGGTFVASTLDVSNAGFLAGGALSFTGSSHAAVVNYGKVGALGGDVALIAAQVSNAGEIAAANGDAGLLAGYKVVLTDASLDDGRFAVELGGAGTSATNSGLIQAADAELRAEGGNVYALAGDTTGVIRAIGVSSGGGHVWLVADKGALDVAGTIQAQGANGTAGAVETSGAGVQLGAARIDAHGGTWLVDPEDLTIDATAANTIDTALNAGTSVTEQTTATGTSGAGTVNTAGNGDIIVAAPLNWTTAAGLTLSAYRNVDVSAGETIASTGGGAVTLTSDNTGTGVGTVAFGAGAGVSTSGVVQLFYNPASYTDAATKSTQAYSNSGVAGTETVANPYTGFVTGGATLQAYMLVNSLAQLEGVSAELDGVYALSKDIDASSSATMNPIAGGGYSGWQPIGSFNNNGTSFTGAFNGQGHAISGLYINRTTNENGLFGDLANAATISNLSLTDASIVGTGSDNGILAGYTTQFSTFSNIVTTGTVSGGRVSGGLAGQDFGVNTNVQSSATVSGSDTLGGLVGLGGGSFTTASATGAVTGTGGTVGGLFGYFNSGALTNVHAAGAVSGVGNVGGLIGRAFGNSINTAYASGVVTDTGSGDQNIGGLIGFAGGGDCNCRTVYQNLYATGVVTAGANAESVGGLFGRFSDSNLSNAYATGAVTAPGGTRVGGLIGDNEPNSYISDTFATGAVTATGASSEVGGLIGYTFATNLSTSYASGAVTGGSDVGGLVGGIINYGNDGNDSPGDGTPGVTISDTYATGSVTGVGSGAGPFYVGGLIGSDTPFDSTSPITVSHSYATGLVSGAGVLGGLIGGNTGTVTNDIWDRTSTGQANGIGTDILVNGASTSTVTNLASVQDTDATAADYAFSATPYTDAGFQFGTVPGGAAGQTWVQVDSDGSFNGAGGAAVATRPFLLMEYATALTNAHQLQLAELSLAANYTVAGDIDASGTATTAGMWGPAGFVPLGTGATQDATSFYSGRFDGQGHTISGLTINAPLGTLSGLFGVVNAGSLIENLTLSGASVYGNSAGILAGENIGAVLNVSTSGSIVGNTAGGLLGFNAGTVNSASSSATVNAYSPAQQLAAEGDLQLGGLVGGQLAFGSSTSISGSHASGAVGAMSASLGPTGGLVGVADGGIVSTSSASGQVTGIQSTGGLVGVLEGGTVQNASASGAVTGSGSSTGGLVGTVAGSGQSGATVADSFATGNVAGVSRVGGLVGFIASAGIGSNTGTVTGSAAGETYASGSVTGTGTSVGGLVGENQGLVSQASYTPVGAGVTGAADVGGVVGLNDAGAALLSVSATGAVMGTSYTGGVVGDNFGVISTGSFDGSVSGGGGVGGIVGVEEGGSSLAGGAVGETLASSVTGTGDDVGGVAGASFAPVNGAQNRASVTGRDDVGGLVGYSAANVIGTSYAGQVSGRDYVGGLVGLNYASALGDTSGAVDGRQYVGGMVGWNDAAGSVSGGSIADVAATGNYAGGLVGVNKGAVTSGAVGLGSTVVGSVAGIGYVGGLVGLNQGSVAYSYSLVPVSGDLYVGGLAGWNDTGATVKTSYATGAVTGLSGGQDASGNDYVGGLVGVNFGSVADSYATGAVSGVQVVGGLVGTNMPGGASVATSYATGAVSVSRGAVGTSFGVQAGEVTSVYGFPALSGQPLESGYTNAGSTGDGTDLTQAEEDGSAAYAGFDFTNTWQSNPNGPPTLKPPVTR